MGVTTVLTIVAALLGKVIDSKLIDNFLALWAEHVAERSDAAIIANVITKVIVSFRTDPNLAVSIEEAESYEIQAIANALYDLGIAAPPYDVLTAAVRLNTEVKKTVPAAEKA